MEEYMDRNSIYNSANAMSDNSSSMYSQKN